MNEIEKENVLKMLETIHEPYDWFVERYKKHLRYGGWEIDRPPPAMEDVSLLTIDNHGVVSKAVWRRDDRSGWMRWVKDGIWLPDGNILAWKTRQ